MLEYLDFDVQIAPLDERDYSVSVASPAGEATGTFHLPFDETALENLRLRLENTLLRSSGPARRGLNEDEQAVQRFGHALFEALMTDRVGRCYAVSRDRAEQEGKGLRLRLRIHEQAPGLAALPWEYLYNKDRGGYLCLSRYTPIVRYLHLPRQREALHVTPPLRILGMIASPKSNALHALDVEKERASLKRDLSGLISRGLVELEWLPGETWRDLQRAMRRGPWHIFHFIGHGGFDEQVEEGVQALADEEGKVKLLHANKLGTLLSAHPSLRLALLNSCEGARASKDNMFSSVGATLAREGIPAVLAMQYDITDSAAQELTTTFYDSLADGLPVDAAVTEVRVAIKVGINNSLEWGTPVLYMRSSDGVLFTITGGDGVNHRPEPDPPRSLIQSEPIPEDDPPRPPIQSEAAPEDDPPRPPIQSEPPVRAADATRKEGDTTSLSDCLSTLTKDNLFTLFMYLTFEHEEKEKSIAFDRVDRDSLLKAILDIAKQDVTVMQKIRRFAEEMTLKSVLKRLATLGVVQSEVKPMTNNDGYGEDKFLTYLRCLAQIRRGDSDDIKDLLAAFNDGRTQPEKKARDYREMAKLMAQNQRDFDRVVSRAKEALSPETFAAFQAGLGGPPANAALVKRFMHPFPEGSVFLSTSTVADLTRFFRKEEFYRYFIVIHEGTRGLMGIISATDYFPNKTATERMPQDTLVTNLSYFNREIVTLREIDTMDSAQRAFGNRKDLLFLFVVDEARRPIGLLSSEEDVKRWRTGNLG